MTPKPETELKALPCPFCGGLDILPGYIRDGAMRMCRHCGASTRAFAPDAFRKATEAWNTRPTEPASVPGDVLERVKAYCDKIVNRAEILRRYADKGGLDTYQAIADTDADQEEQLASDLRALLAAVPVIEGASSAREPSSNASGQGG